MIYKNEKPAILMFQDGTYFEGIGFGAVKKVVGEMTFTGIPGSGYVEILTDPTYRDKIVLFTYPCIGNFGVKAKDKDDYGILKHFESNTTHLKGMIVNEYCDLPHHYESVRTLEDWMIEEDIPGIQWIDTRMLTQMLVEKGSQIALIQVLNNGEKPDIEKLKDEIKSIGDLSQKTLTEDVSVKEIITYIPQNPQSKVIIIDLGVKNNIIRTLLAKSCEVVIVPWNTTYEKIMELNPKGVLVSSGPGNPSLLTDSINTIKILIENSIPTIGIGLGNVLIGLAADADYYKMTAEHRGGRTTVESATGLCYITFQNHAFCLKDVEKGGFKQYFHDKDDDTNEGIIHESKPIFSVGFNPEASPGALDMLEMIFNKFIKLMEV
jgi:carbamoyl-phosphate synthase small subunit